MKKWSLLLVGMLISVGLFSSTSFAYNPVKQHAKQAYRTTAEILVEAQDTARIGRDYQGLSSAFTHHRLARNHYYARNFQTSIQHSIRARQIAYQVIERNNHRIERWERINQRRHRRRVHSEARYSDYELRYSQQMSQNNLDKKIDNHDDDEVYLKFKININL